MNASSWFAFDRQAHPSVALWPYTDRTSTAALWISAFVGLLMLVPATLVALIVHAWAPVVLVCAIVPVVGLSFFGLGRLFGD